MTDLAFYQDYRDDTTSSIFRVELPGKLDHFFYINGHIIHAEVSMVKDKPE